MIRGSKFDQYSSPGKQLNTPLVTSTC